MFSVQFTPRFEIGTIRAKPSANTLSLTRLLVPSVAENRWGAGFELSPGAHGNRMHIAATVAEEQLGPVPPPQRLQPPGGRDGEFCRIDMGKRPHVHLGVPRLIGDIRQPPPIG